MAAGIQEVFTLEYNGFNIEVTVSEAYDILANQSDVSVGMRVKSAYKKGMIYPSGSVKIDGTTLVTMNSTISTHNIPITAYNTYYNVEKSSDSYTDSPWTMVDIAHNTDGSKTITLEVSLRGYDAGGYLSFQVADSRSITLTHIPRASTIGATDADIGAVSMIAVSRKSTAYTHSVAYAFGSLKGYITTDGGISEMEEKMTASGIAFTVPETFYAQIPNSASGQCTLTCKTYSGNTQVGDTQTAKFTVTANKTLCNPAVSGTVVDSNTATLALTGDKNVLVRYASHALCTITASAKNGASITQRTIAGVKADSRTIAGIEQGSVVFACTDSRGYSNGVTVEKALIPYIHLTANVSAKRSDPTSGKAVLTVSGKYYHGSFGEASNILAIEYRVNGGEAVVLEGTVDGNSYQAEAALSELDYQSAHSIQVTVSDRLETVVKTVTVGKGIPVFDWGEKDVQFHVPVYVEGVNVGGAKINVLWRNPSWTSSFAPQSVTWETDQVYNAYIITFVYNTSYGYETSTLVNNYSVYQGRNGFGYFAAGQVSSESATLSTVWRYCSPYSNGQGCTFGPGYLEGTVNNYCCIPMSIYGIKW